MIDITKLRGALNTEAASQSILADLAKQVDTAIESKAAILVKRAAAMANVATGAPVTEVAKLDNAIHVAERTVTILSEAFALAQTGAREAEEAVATILRSELAQRAAAADAAYAEAELAYKEAAARCRAAFAVVQSAKGAVSLPSSNLRLHFREALADAEA